MREFYLRSFQTLCRKSRPWTMMSSYNKINGTYASACGLVQQKIVKDFTEKYGEDYVKQYVAVPGYSEHHTGLALDLYFRLDGVEVYENEDLRSSNNYKFARSRGA